MKPDIYDILDLLWHFIGRWIVMAIGGLIIAGVIITVVVLLWWLFLPLFLLGFGGWLISLASR